MAQQAGHKADETGKQASHATGTGTHEGSAGAKLDEAKHRAQAEVDKLRGS